MAIVKDVAKYFINLSVESTPYAITPLKLQKLLYYAQGFHLMRTNRSLFNEDLEAWPHGPVVRSVYFDYKNYGYRTIPYEPFINDSNSRLSNEEIAIIKDVWEKFGKLDGKTLEELTHQEDPWLNTELNKKIDIGLVREYFENEYLY